MSGLSSVSVHGDHKLSFLSRRGFTEEGRIRKGVWIEGAWEDIILMGILDEEWAERHWNNAVSINDS